MKQEFRLVLEFPDDLDVGDVARAIDYSFGAFHLLDMPGVEFHQTSSSGAVRWHDAARRDVQAFVHPVSWSTEP